MANRPRPLTIPEVVSTIKQRRAETRTIQHTFGTSPQMEAKINAYDFCLDLLKKTGL